MKTYPWIHPTPTHPETIHLSNADNHEILLPHSGPNSGTPISIPE